jgi:hypothetical protein
MAATTGQSFSIVLQYARGIKKKKKKSEATKLFENELGLNVPWMALF